MNRQGTKKPIAVSQQLRSAARHGPVGANSVLLSGFRAGGHNGDFMARTIYPVILSGGSGTRLWPLSRDLLPKQLLSLIGEESLLAATVRRVAGDGYASPIVVCNQDHRFMVREQLAKIGIRPEAIIIEPAARDTAPAIAAAAIYLLMRDANALMLVLPSDHIIRNLPEFATAVAQAAKTAEAGYLVTFGITPTAPETGYGYIASGSPIPGVDGAFRIARFVEKPDVVAAAHYLAEGRWSWNSGMFVFPLDLMVAELARLEPQIIERVAMSIERARREGDVVSLDADAFGQVASKSIDYALMEQTEMSAIVPANLGWSDVGSWSALWEIAEKDPAGNVAIGDVMVEESRGSYLRSEGPLVAALGLENVVLVATKDVVMAAAKNRTQEVKRFVSRLRDHSRSEAVSHVDIQQPWGSSQTLDSAAGYQVRRLTVKPGAEITGDRQAKAAEDWVVVDGVAQVTRGDGTVTLRTGMSVHIPAGMAHRLKNIGTELLVVIEVQAGTRPEQR